MNQKVLPGASVVTGVATTASSDDLEAAEAEFKSGDAARMNTVNPSPKGLPFVGNLFKRTGSGIMQTTIPESALACLSS